MNHAERKLTDADVVALAKELDRIRSHECRFDELDPDDLREAIDFYKNFNRIMDEAKFTTFKVVLTLGVTGLAALLVLGLSAKLRGFIVN